MDGSVVFARWRQRALPYGEYDSTCAFFFFSPPKSTTQTANRSVQPFLHSWRQKVPILYNGTPILTPKFAPSRGGSEPPSNTWSLGPSQVLNPYGISIGSAVFAGLTGVGRYYFAVWTFETFSELLFRLNTYMPINSIEVRIHLNYKFNLRLSNFIINSSILNTYSISRYF